MIYTELHFNSKTQKIKIRFLMCISIMIYETITYLQVKFKKGNKH